MNGSAGFLRSGIWPIAFCWNSNVRECRRSTMSLADRTRKVLRRIVLGGFDLPAQCTLGLSHPQAEISVWLHGAGRRARDVTESHVLACAAPFRVGICLENNWSADLKESARLSLKFCERDAEKRVLGEIGIRPMGAVPAGDRRLQLFEIRSCKNYCLPRVRLWAYYLYQEYLRYRGNKDPEVPMSLLGAHAMIVYFICPRPVVFVSVQHEEILNIFP